MPANSDQEIIISNKLEDLRLKISNWQILIDNDDKLITFDSINTDHNALKGNIHSLYLEALYARVTDKLSYDVIGLVGLIDRIKRGVHRYIRNEERIANAKCNNIASDIKYSLSTPGSVPCDNESLIIAGGCSGFENNTDLVTQTSLGIITAALQMQGGGY